MITHFRISFLLLHLKYKNVEGGNDKKKGNL